MADILTQPNLTLTRSDSNAIVSWDIVSGANIYTYYYEFIDPYNNVVYTSPVITLKPASAGGTAPTKTNNIDLLANTTGSSCVVYVRAGISNIGYYTSYTSIETSVLGTGTINCELLSDGTMRISTTNVSGAGAYKYYINNIYVEGSISTSSSAIKVKQLQGTYEVVAIDKNGYTRSIGTDSYKFSSNPSPIIASTQPTFNSIKYTWTTDDDEVLIDHYVVSINGGELINVTSTEYTINNLLSQTYTISVYSVAVNELFNSTISSKSSTIGMLSNPVLKQSNPTFNSIMYYWNIVPNANCYYYSFNNIDFYKTTNIYVQNDNLLEGAYTIYVYAKYEYNDGTGIISNTMSIAGLISKLDNVEVKAKQDSFNTVTFYWDEVENATDYFYKIDNEIKWSRVDKNTTSITVSDLQKGEHKIIIYASFVYDDGTSIDSDTSEANIIIGDIEPPSITVELTNINQVKASATKYSTILSDQYFYFSIDDEKEIEGQTVFFSNLSLGNHTIKAYAKIESGKGYIISGTTEKVINITKLPTPILSKNTIGDGFVFTYDNPFVQGFRVGISTDGEHYDFSTIKYLPSNTRSYILPKQSTGSYFYKIQAYYILNNDKYPSNYFDSDYSNEMGFVVTDLKAPTIYWDQNTDGIDTSILKIESVEFADYYKISVNDRTITSTTELKYDGIQKYINNAIGKYSVKVEAASNSSIYNSSTSDYIYYYVDKINNPIINYDPSSRRITWKAVSAAYYTKNDITEYDIYVDDMYVNSTKSTEWTLPSTLTSASIYIIAHCDTEDPNYPNPLHIPSDESNTISIGTYDTPSNLRVEDGVLCWDIKTGAMPSKYLVYNYGILYATTNENRMPIPTVREDTFLFAIKVPATEYTNASELSDTLEVHVIKLQTPTITVDTNGDKYILNFNPINNATYYKLYINGDYNDVTVLPGLDISKFLTAGSNDIRIQACNNDVLIINSDLSNIVTKYIKPQHKYYAILDNKEEREVLLPFTITDAADETLSTGSCSFYDDNPEPYQTNTDISIRIASNTEEDDEYIDNSVDIKTFNMIIYGDQVEQHKTSTGIKYLHNLTLLEQTKLLDYELMPDISFTQPQGVSEIFIERNPVIPDDNGYIVYNKLQNQHTPINPIYFKNEFIETNFNKMINSTVYTPYSYNETIKLPYTSDPNYYHYIEGTAVAAGGVYYDGESYATTIRYYIRKHINKYEKDPNYPEYEIASHTYGDSMPVFAPSKFTEMDLSKGSYDIIIEIDDWVDHAVYKNITKDITWSEPFTGMYKKSTINNKKKEFVHFRRVYKNIQFTENSYELDPNAITIHDAIVKVINCIEPIRYSSSYADKHEATKYILDDDFLNEQKYNKMLCPQVSYTGQKTLFEILQDLGRTFNGIPVLENKTIKFRIMNGSNVPMKVEDTKLYSTESTSENNVTSLSSSVKNMITGTYDIQWFPGQYEWITPRSTDESSGIISIDNCGIVLDKPIYKIQKVLMYIENMFGNYEEIDITKYVVEQTVYNTLPNTKDGIGKSLYYSRGDNKIYGLGQLTPVSRWAATMGYSSTTYVINCILDDYFGVNYYHLVSDRVKDYQFRIEYIPYVDTQVKVTQFNLSKVNKLSCKAYNQTENLVIDDKLGKTMATQIERLGNTDIGREYYTTSFMKVYDDDGRAIADTGLAELFDCLEFNGDKYFIDKVKYTFNNSYITVGENFSKNYNKINDRIGVNSEYREYEIPLNATADRVLYFNQYCYIDTKEYFRDLAHGIDTTQVRSDWKTELERLFKNEISSIYIPSYFMTSYRTLDGELLTYKDFNNTIQQIDYSLLCPVTKLRLNSAIQFTGKMFDNFSAGTYADKSVKDSKYGYYGNKDARYVDGYGRADIMSIGLIPKLGLYYVDESMYPKYEGPYYPSYSYFVGDYYIDKDASESLTFNYQMNFHTLNKNINIGSGFTKYLYSDKNLSVAPKIVAYTKKSITMTTDYIEVDDIKKDYGFVYNHLKYSPFGTLYIKDITVPKDYNLAIIWPSVNNGNPNEVLLYIDTDDITTDTISLYFNFLDKAILQNNLDASKVNN